MRKSPQPAYIGTQLDDPERLKRYDLARVHGGFSTRADFFKAACDKLADEILAQQTAGVASASQPAA